MNGGELHVRVMSSWNNEPAVTDTCRQNLLFGLGLRPQHLFTSVCVSVRERERASEREREKEREKEREREEGRAGGRERGREGQTDRDRERERREREPFLSSPETQPL